LRPLALIAAAGLLAAPLAPRAAPKLVLALDDPPHDATGPGSYQPPGDSDFRDGDFDLRRFAVHEDGEDLVLEVTLGAPIRRPEVAHRTNAVPADLANGIYLQNIDVYVDTDPAAPGFTACIPGRRVAFAGGRSWKAAVVLTPQPGPARAVAEAAMGDAARRVLFAQGIRSKGRTLVARVPAGFFGGSPRPEWGWSVQLSGARWERSFTLTDRLRGGAEADAYTMPVQGTREAWAFGGAPDGEAHSRVVDVILPVGVDQKAVLASYDAAKGKFAEVPFVYGRPTPTVTPTATASKWGGLGPASGETQAASPPPSPPLAPAQAHPPAPALALAPTATATPTALTVADVMGEMVTISGPTAGLRPMQIGRVLGADGGTVARVVLLQVHEKGAVATAVDGKERIARGAAVRFDGQ